MIVDGLDTIHSGRLRSANEWGNLADAIYNNQDTEDTANHKAAEIIATAHNIVEDVLNTVGGNENIVVAQEMHFTKTSTVEPLEDDEDENNSEKQKISIKSNTESDDINIYPVSTIPISGTKINIHYDDDKNEDYDTNIPDDMKVSRYPFGSLERPKSDVLKKLLSSQKIDIDLTTHVSGIADESSMNSKIIIGDNTNISNDNIGEPISLTLINNSDMIENDQTESSQISPIYSSNNNGINSINISSIELNILPENNMHYYKPPQQQPNSDNIVTISTELSQPSSITMIDDEHLDFNLQTLEDEDDEEFLKNERLLQELEFQEDLGILMKNETVKSNDSNKTNFITEITVKSITNKDNDENGSDNLDEDIIQINNNNNISIKNTSREISVTRLNNNIVDNGSVVHKSNIVKPTVLPRNTEIKFTTSTYESPQQQNNKINEKRVYHIDQIRSNFEKNSEIPLPIRKSSITSSTSSLNSSSTTITPKSPSKIPVFNSNKVSHSTSSLADNSQRSPPQYSHINHSNNNHNNSNVNINTTSNNNLNNGNNRVSVSVTSIIRNQAKHPSGRLNQ